MKLLNLFNVFLTDTVNLNETRVTDLEKSIEAIKDAVRASTWEPHINGWMSHGSWAHQTIIRPVDGGEFDADLLVFVEHIDGWTAATYIEELYDAFRGHSTYKDKVSRSSHCITINYATDKKIDIAPCLTDRTAFNQLEVCNRTENKFERTEPREYTSWLIERNTYSGSNSFRKVTRLVKYMRDVKTRFSCTSVLLTTILGYHISSNDRGSADFADTPTALRTVFARMDDWLQRNPTKPVVTNPFLTSENFADAWDDDQYANFREKIHTYREWIEDAFNEEDRDESIAKWRRVFGHDFAKGIVLEEARTVTKSVVAQLKNSVSTAALFNGDLVEAVKRFGFDIIPPRFYRLPYMDKPTWKQAAQLINVQVKADLHRSEGGEFLRAVQGTDPLPPGLWLHFRALSNVGTPFNAEYTVQWRVTNTDEAAYLDNCLRGEFYKPKSDNTKWEELKYRGVHLVEAYVVRKRGDLLIGKSDPFQVVVA